MGLYKEYKACFYLYSLSRVFGLSSSLIFLVHMFVGLTAFENVASAANLYDDFLDISVRIEN